MATNIAVVLDRSGSMTNMATEAAEAVNTFIASLSSIAGKKTVTINQFDDRFSTTCVDVAPAKVPKLVNGENYVPRGMTSLYDAIGQTIKLLDKKKNVVMCILTDGGENSSKDFTYDTIKKLIDEKTASGWKFEFLASNIKDVIAGGMSLGIHTTAFADNSAGYSTRSAYMTQTVSSYVADVANKTNNAT